MRTEAAFQVLTVFGFKDGQTRVEELALGDDDNVEARCDFVTTKNLSYQSFSPISLDGATQLSCRRDSQASHSELVREDKQRGVTPVNADSASVYVLKVRAAADPLVGSEPGHLLISDGTRDSGIGIRIKRMPPNPESRIPSPVRYHLLLLTVRRLRPFARRRLRTSRPFFVLIRTRKPWVRLRCRVFGWNVRLPFIPHSGGTGAPSPSSRPHRPARVPSVNRISNVSERLPGVSIEAPLC